MEGTKHYVTDDRTQQIFRENDVFGERFVTKGLWKERNDNKDVFPDPYQNLSLMCRKYSD